MLYNLESNTINDSNVAVEELVGALTKEIEVQAKIAKREKELQGDRLALGITYIHILEAGGHFGC